jgi:hypothetical protein
MNNSILLRPCWRTHKQLAFNMLRWAGDDIQRRMQGDPHLHTHGPMTIVGSWTKARRQFQNACETTMNNKDNGVGKAQASTFAEAVLVRGLKSDFWRNLVKLATVVRAYDTRTGKDYVLYSGQGHPNNLGTTPKRGVEVAFGFDPRTPELQYLCKEVKHLKGSCQQPPPEIMNLFAPKLVSVGESAAGHSLSERQTIRLLTDKRHNVLPLAGNGAVKSLMVDEQTFAQRVRRGRKKVQKSLLFYEVCISQGLDPKATLKLLVFDSFHGQQDKKQCDMDLACAGVNLVIERNFDFLRCLDGRVNGGGSFGAAVAALMPPAPQSAGRAKRKCSKKDFLKHWAQCKRMLHAKLIGACRIVDLDLLTMEPNYLKRLGGTDIPEWARRSVLPFRVTERIAKILKEINELAVKDPHFRGTLEDIIAEIAKLDPKIEASSIAAEDRDPETKKALDALSLQLKEKSGHKGAKRVCWALLRRIHQDRIQADRKGLAGHMQGPPGRQKFVRNWLGPVGERNYARAVVNRIFASGRSVKV